MPKRSKKSKPMSDHLQDDFWPSPLRHLAQPFVAENDEEVIIGEITGEPDPELMGIRMLFTALVPKAEADAVLKTRGGIGHGVQTNGPRPSIGPDSRYRPAFWIAGPDGRKFDTLVSSWRIHNKTVVVPDNGLLMCYGLVPRYLKDGSLAWDDLSAPVYEVLRVIPVSEYSVTKGHTTARVTIRRDYLEDYLSLRECIAVATYFEERYSLNDAEIDAILKGRDGTSQELPGREIWIKRSHADRLGNQLSQVWGCSLLLAPKARPISEEQERKLTWPDRKTPIGPRDRGVFEPFEDVYIRDEVLVAYEKRPEFDINPESGSVSYGSWWSASFCRRYGRNHIEMELRKLYETAPFDVVKHYNKFAVTAELAERDRNVNGERHIGDRAKELIYAFLRLTLTLSQLSDAIGLPCTQAEMGGLATGEVNYKGWWTFPNLRSLAYVVPLTLTFPDFLSRCKEILKLFENLQPAPLRRLLIKLGIDAKKIEDFKSLKLLGTVCQLAKIATDNGLDLVSNGGRISAEWRATQLLNDLAPLFALNVLRTLDAHASDSSTKRKISDALAAFDIDEEQYRTGWGKALDGVYDRLASSLQAIEELVARAWA
jgi:hypothetical protein